MDITFEHAFAERRGDADPVRRLWRSAVVVVIFGSLAVWVATSALASGASGGFVLEPVAVTTDAGALFSLPALAPGRTVTRYATVASTGSPASIRLYATVSGTGLDRFLTLTVTRGTDGTNGFVPVGADDEAGPGIVFSGRLRDFPQTWDAGVHGGSWAPGETRTFRFEITLSDRAGARGLTAGADFRWEARQA
jgi:hypothetical protein